MGSDDWHATAGRVAMMLNGVGQRSLVLLFNPSHEDADFVMPEHVAGTRWRVLVETGSGIFEPDWAHLDAGSPMTLGSRAMCVLETLEPLT